VVEIFCLSVTTVFMLPFGAEPFVHSPAVKNVKVRIYKTVREEHKLRV
jgi:hypothetical protein